MTPSFATFPSFVNAVGWMPRLLSFLVFFLVVSLLVAGAHTYIYRRLVRDLHFSSGLARGLKLAVIVLALSVPVNFILARALPPEVTRPWVATLFTWFGLAFYLVLLLAVRDLGVFLLRFVEISPSLRHRLLHGSLLGVGVLTIAVASVGLVGGLAPPSVKKVTIALRNLHSSQEGLVLLQLSDLHIGPTLQREFVEDLVRRANEQKPDLVVITGDLVDGEVETMGELVRPLSRLRTRHGTYFVTGNHEFYSGAENWLRFLESLGIQVLANRRVTVGEGDATLELAGIHDPQGKSFGHPPDLARTLAGRDAQRPLVLLAHQPKAVFEAERAGVDLVLSGHTHGGQIWPFRYLVRLQQPFIDGLVRVGATQLYVSPGTGHWGPPLRVLAPSEITRIELVRAR